MEEGRKRVLAIVAGILMARHLTTTEDLFDSKPSPRTESLVASAVQWAERIMKKIDSVYRQGRLADDLLGVSVATSTNRAFYVQVTVPTRLPGAG